MTTQSLFWDRAGIVQLYLPSFNWKVSITVATASWITKYCSCCPWFYFWGSLNLPEVETTVRVMGASTTVVLHWCSVWLHLNSLNCEILCLCTCADTQELKRWGMSNAAHRKAFLDGKSRIQLAKQEDNTLEDNSQDALNQSSPALFPSTPSSQPAPFPSSQLSQGSQQLSQLSTASTPPSSQAIEVVRIQMTTKFSNP